MKLHLWNGLLWDADMSSGPYAHCPEHRQKLDVLTVSQFGDQYLLSQDASTSSLSRQPYLICPKDQKRFVVAEEDFSILQRHFKAALESIDLRDAEIVDLDGYQIPIVKSVPNKKDDDYWAEVRINETKRGKQLVVYAGKRGAHNKAQIFVDPGHDKITFDQNNMHPNDIFTKITAEFDSGKKTTLEK